MFARSVAALSVLVLALSSVTLAFVHPGVLVSAIQLDHTRAMVKANQEPWKSAWGALQSSGFISLTRQPQPRATVECGSYSKPNNGCTEERQDAIAAYSCALAWYITQDDKYAKKAISYFDAWSGTLKSHTNSNAPLQTGWAGASWPRAAEIIRHTYKGWSQSSIDKFSDMLRNVYLSKLIGGSNSNGNWELVMMEAAIGISVFLDDQGNYNKALDKFKTRAAAYVYLSKDGALPKTVPSQNLHNKDQIVKYWQGQSKFVNGLTQETCRDFVHTGYGLASMSNIAETTRIQSAAGSLWKADVGERIHQALEFHTNLENGAGVPSWLCKGKVNKGLGPITEVGLNALTRRKISVPNTKTYTEKHRPMGTDLLFVAWGTLTHADQPQ